MISVAILVAGCQSNAELKEIAANQAFPAQPASQPNGAVAPPPAVASPAPAAFPPQSVSMISPAKTAVPPAQAPPERTSGGASPVSSAAVAHGSGAPAVTSTGSTKPREPLGPVLRHVKAFYAPVVTVYEKPYGKVAGSFPEKSFPRVPMGTTQDATGVPVYDANGAFVKVGLPGGGAGWVTIDMVQLEAKPCKFLDPTTRANGGAIGAGASDVTCAE